MRICYGMNEYQKARAWAEKHDLSAQQVADLTGYGVRAVHWFWSGQSPPNGTRAKAGKISPWVFQRFKRACQGVDAQLRSRKEFNWGD